MAAKRTAELIPLCHPVGLDHVEVEVTLDETLPGVRVRAAAKAVGRTGVEMEALSAVSVALLTVYDMVKAVDRGMEILSVRLLEKTGGTRRGWRRDDPPRGLSGRCATAPGFFGAGRGRTPEGDDKPNPGAKSREGARGLTQVLPSTARLYEPGLTTIQLYERDTNLRLGFRYLHDLLERYSGRLDLALLAYNRGPGRVTELLNSGRNPENGYAATLMKGYRRKG